MPFPRLEAGTGRKRLGAIGLGTKRGNDRRLGAKVKGEESVDSDCELRRRVSAGPVRVSHFLTETGQTDQCALIG